MAPARWLIGSRIVGAAAALLMAGAACAPITEVGSGTGERKVVVGEPAKAGEVSDGGTLRMALSADPDVLDPTQSRSLVSRHVFHATCEKLYDVNADAKIVPQLATALPTVSDDGRTYTIPVRAGVKFADGTPFDAAAVKTSIERGLNLPTSARKSELGPIASVEAPNPKTVVVRLSAPFAPLTAVLADRAGMVMSPAALDRLGEDFGTDPVCVGPFKLDRRVAQNSIELVRDPHYYAAEKVHFDRIVYQIITDAKVRDANVRSGEAQVADTLSTQDVARMATDDSLELLESESLGYQGLTFNVGNSDGAGKPPKPGERPHARDPRVRQAFAYAIDRESLARTVFRGIHSVACSPISPASEFDSEKAQNCREHDPAKAKRLLKQAGVKTPYKITMHVTNTPDVLRLAQALQVMAKEGGFEVELAPTEFASLLDLQDRGDFELTQIGWSGRIDPDGNTTTFAETQGSQNIAGFSDKEVDDLLTKARRSQDDGERSALYGRLSARLRETAPLIYLYRQRNLTSVSTDVRGVQVFPDGIVRVAFAGFAK